VLRLFTGCSTSRGVSLSLSNGEKSGRDEGQEQKQTQAHGDERDENHEEKAACWGFFVDSRYLMETVESHPNMGSSFGSIV